MEPQEIRDLIQNLRSFTVDNLKRVIRGFNENGVSTSITGRTLKLSGTKADLFASICHVIRTGFHNQRAKFNLASNVVLEVGRFTSSPARIYHSPALAPAYRAPIPTPEYNRGYLGYAGNASTSTAANNRPPVPAHSNGYADGAGPSSVTGTSAASNVNEPIRFRPSPFYRIERAIGPVSHLQRAGQGDRKVAVVNFIIPEDLRQLLLASRQSPSNKQYQARLYCTTEDHFNMGRPAHIQQPSPIEFPATCEIKLNNIPIAANTKGIKNKAGTAPPVDLGKGGALSIQSEKSVNRLEMIYINTDKRHSIVVYLVEVTTIDQLVNRVKNGPVRSKEEIVKNIIEMNADPDVEASALSLSLKDPLTMSRLAMPTRSKICNHNACFDAKIFFMINEQTPAWTCPICSKVLNVEDLFMDGFVQDILQSCDSEVDQVAIEPDGTWHLIEDEQSTKPSRAGSVKPDPDGVDSKGKARDLMTDSLILDDSDDDDASAPKASGNASSSASTAHGTANGTNGGTSTPRGTKRPAMDTIDLTLSDSDEDEGPLAARSWRPPVVPHVAPPVRLQAQPPTAPRSFSNLPNRPGSFAPHSVAPPRPPSTASNGSNSQRASVDPPQPSRSGSHNDNLPNHHNPLTIRLNGTNAPTNGTANGGANRQMPWEAESYTRRKEFEEAAWKRRRDVDDYEWARR